MPADEIYRTLETLFEPSQIIELRALGKTKNDVRCTFFQDHKQLAEKAETLNNDNTVKGIYVVLNKIKDEQPDGATTDKDIERRYWLPIDFDPKRPTDTSSSTEEHELALETARDCRETLAELGWPDPILADSGNGAHLLYRIDLPNDKEGKSLQLIGDCLRALAAMFSNDKVEVDVKNSNAARIWKLYGTCTRKGKDTAERPWRRSQLIDVPTEIKPVPEEFLKTLASTYQIKRNSERFRDNRPRRKIDLEKWLVAHGLNAAKTKPFTDGGILYILDTCPWDASHTDRSAYAIQWPSGVITVRCHHNRCDSKDWPDLLKLHGEPDENKNQWEIRDEHSPSITLEDVCNVVTKKDGKEELKFSPTKAAKAVSKILKIITTKDDVMWIYKDGLWVPEGALVVHKILNNVAGDLYTLRIHRETIAKLGLITLKEDMIWNPDPYKFGVANGIIDLKDGTFKPYEAEDYITLRSPITYDPDAKCPEIARFLYSSLKYEEDILTVIDLFVALSCTTAFPYFVSLIGPGSNGKKVLETIMQSFVGFDQVTHVRLDLLDTNPFIRGDIKDKQLLINTEVSGKKMESHWAKAISAGDRIESDRKYSTRIEFTPYCLIVFDTNDPPKFYDRSYGFARRFAKLDFPYVFTNKPNPNNPRQKLADRDLEKKVITQQELSGLLNIVIKRASEIIRTGKIYRRRSGAEILAEYDMQSHSVSTFVENFLYVDGNAFIPTQTLYESYQRFCWEVNTVPQKINVLGSNICKTLGLASRAGRVGTRNLRGFYGVKLSDEALEDALRSRKADTNDKDVLQLVEALLPK